ncbi:PREDICTED: uncharacterized protein LOC109587071 [Amphimedon queenslandica]|uniref:Cadherin domain-containing protein n=1 Tax=Amphimedon queenslandica TaxID=400682 RepID=A0AAN0JP96_AMPQE|nr:PREDICTED: uncharacterized protein LOC109587071 [Amphimedon queenslandica]|eukprot:XP_019858850.1 PREDICTED: uncharacterized protein LOC109587071 [Amphimedon queenslandica]
MSSSGLDLALGVYFLVVVVLTSPLSGNTESSTNCDINPTERLTDFAATTRHLQEDAITISPKTTTGYVGGNISANATIPLPDGCTGPIIFVNDYKLSTPCTNLIIYHGADGREHLIYTINGVEHSVNGTRIDVCIFCMDHYECFVPAYFYVKGRPNIMNNDILIKVTCNEVVITGNIDKDARLTVEIKDSSNVTIYKEDSLTLPHSINGSVFNPRDEYQLTAVATNKAGDSNPLTYNLNFDVNMTADFSIGSTAVKYVNDTVKALFYITVNKSCSLLYLDYLNVESSCLAGGHALLYLNESFSFLLDLLMDQQQCVIDIELKTTKKEAIVDTSRIPNIRIWPRVTHDGYYSINATLLNGVTGVMVQVLYLNGTVFFKQPILRNSLHHYAIANSSTQLSNGTFNVFVYPLLSDGRSFDSNHTAMNFSVTCTMSHDPSDDTPTTKKRNVPVGLIVIVLISVIFALLLIVAIIVVILLGVGARRLRRTRRYAPHQGRRDDGGGGDDGGGEGGNEGRVDEGGAVLRGMNRDVDIEINDVVANRSGNEENNDIGQRQVQVNNVENGDNTVNTGDESINTPTPSLHNGGQIEPATADKHKESATVDSASAQNSLAKPMEATEVGEGDGRPVVISTGQSCRPPAAQDTTCSSEAYSWTELLPQNVVPSKSTSILDVFKKKKTHQGHDQPVPQNEGLDQLQRDDFPLSEPIAGTDCETKPNFVPGMVRQGSIQVDDAAASSQQVYVSPASSLNTHQLN